MQPFVEERVSLSGSGRTDTPRACTVLHSTPFVRALLIIASLQFVVLIIVPVLLVKLSPREVPTPPCVEPCPMDWLYNGRKCYHFSKEEAEWEDSQGFCASSNASLALIDTQEELDFMMDLICRKHLWIGLRHNGTQFHWVNGTACNSTVCGITDEGECVYIGSNALRVSGCSLIRPYICNKRPCL
ncbi:C-type lectin domain family 2 member L-like isoform X2 [Ambystoma mexicanum]|uniref:C-type lectin domain family 2 member L-like isoform X2 n=1 Tax=Ambystoma mexicanum TaxID=8296 RepID=UPI0037E8BB53